MANALASGSWQVTGGRGRASETCNASTPLVLFAVNILVGRPEWLAPFDTACGLLRT